MEKGLYFSCEIGGLTGSDLDVVDVMLEEALSTLICQVKVPMNVNQMRHATLIWYYQPGSATALLASKGKVSSEATVGMINEEPR